MKKVLAACLIAAFLGVWGLASFNTHTVTKVGMSIMGCLFCL